MKNKIKQGLYGGIAATFFMSAFMMLIPIINMPKISPPKMLATMMELPILFGWIMHFMIGVIFALAYVFFFMNWVKNVNSNVLKGIIFGVAAFIFAQIAITTLGAMMGGMPASDDSMMLITIIGIVSHVIFGIVVALFIKVDSSTDNFELVQNGG